MGKLGMFSLEKRITWGVRGDINEAEPSGELGRDWGQGMEGQDTGNGLKLEKGRFKLDIGKEFLAGRVMMFWHRVPREAVAAPGSLEVFKARLYRDWSNQ